MNADDRAALRLLVLYATDLESAQQFYAMLGLQFEREQHGQGPQHYAANAGSVVFELYPAASVDSAASEQLHGKVRLGFEVSRLDALVADLQRGGATIVTPPRDSPWGRRAVVDDPEGNRVELVQRERGPQG